MLNAASTIIQEPYNQRPKADSPVPVVLRQEPHGLTPESLAEVDFVPFPLDLAVGADLPHSHPKLVLRGGYPAGVGPERRTVPVGGRLLSQCLMRPLLIVGLAEGVKGSLLPSPVRLRWTGRLCLERPVQSLQASVLLRVTGFYPLRDDAQLDPPHRKRRQAPQDLRLQREVRCRS